MSLVAWTMLYNFKWAASMHRLAHEAARDGMDERPLCISKALYYQSRQAYWHRKVCEWRDAINAESST